MHCIWVTDVFVAQTSPVNLHGHRGEKSTKRKKEGYGCAQDLIWAPSLADCSHRCHAAFYNSDLCWANVQIAFLSAIPGFWALKPERSQHERDCGADLQRHYFVSVTAPCQFPLSLYTFQSEVQQRGWQMSCALCSILPSSVFPGGRAQLGRVNTCQHNQFKSKCYKQKQIRACLHIVYSNTPQESGGRRCEMV